MLLYLQRKYEKRTHSDTFKVEKVLNLHRVKHFTERTRREQEGEKRNVNSTRVKQVMDPGKRERGVTVWPSQKDATWQGPGLGCFACSQ